MTTTTLDRNSHDMPRKYCSRQDTCLISMRSQGYCSHENRFRVKSEENGQDQGLWGQSVGPSPMSQCASSEGMTLKPSMTSEPSITNCSGFLVPRMHLSDIPEPAFLHMAEVWQGNRLYVPDATKPGLSLML